jgi:hypothetical protein
LIDLNPVEIDNAEGAAKGVLRILALAHLEVSSNLSNETASLSEALIVDVLKQLETTGLQEPSLKSLRHFFLF